MIDSFNYNNYGLLQARSLTAMPHITRAKQSIQCANDSTNDILLCVHCNAMSRNLLDVYKQAFNEYRYIPFRWHIFLCLGHRI